MTRLDLKQKNGGKKNGVRALSINPFNKSIEVVRSLFPPPLTVPEQGRRYSSRYRDFAPMQIFGKEEGTKYQVVLLSNPVGLSDPNAPSMGFRFSRIRVRNRPDEVPDVTSRLLELADGDSDRVPRRPRSHNGSPADLLLSQLENLRYMVSDCVGTGLLVAFKLVQDELFPDGDTLGEPIDLEWDPTVAAHYLISWTEGFQSQNPKFTCALQAKFDEPWKRQIQFRFDNKDELDAWYGITLDRDIRVLSPEVIDFSLFGVEITVMIGRVKEEDSKVKVVILRTDLAHLPQIAAATVAVGKAGDWIARRLEAFFAEQTRSEKRDAFEEICWVDEVYAEARDHGRPAVTEESMIKGPNDIWQDASAPKREQRVEGIIASQEKEPVACDESDSKRVAGKKNALQCGARGKEVHNDHTK